MKLCVLCLLVWAGVSLHVCVCVWKYLGALDCSVGFHIRPWESFSGSYLFSHEQRRSPPALTGVIASPSLLLTRFLTPDSSTLSVHKLLWVKTLRWTDPTPRGQRYWRSFSAQQTEHSFQRLGSFGLGRNVWAHTEIESVLSEISSETTLFWDY